MPTDSRAIVIARGEHIHIEAEPDTVAAPTALRRRKVLSSYSLKSRLRGCETEVSIHEDHFVAVRTVRPDAQPRKYEVDLRFANPKPVLVRSISWFWLALAACLMLLAASGLVFTWTDPGRWSSPIFLTALGTLLAAGGRDGDVPAPYLRIAGIRQRARRCNPGERGRRHRQRARRQAVLHRADQEHQRREDARGRRTSRSSCATKCASITGCASSA